jgi:hypothetical protein
MHLVEPLGPRSLRKVVKDLGGVQAQVASAAALQCQVRARGLSVEAIDRALYEQKSLIKVWGMRGTLHWIEATDFPIWAAALSIRPRWDRARENFWNKEFGLTWAEVERSIDAVMEILDGRCLTRSELADGVYKRLRNTKIDERLRSGWGEITKIVAYRGGICFGPSEGRNITFVRADQWVPGWKEIDPEESQQRVLLRYLASHGPATREEFARWWGFQPADARKVIEPAASQLIQVDREGDKAYIRKKDLPELQRSEEDDTLRLLGMFDAYTLAGLPHDEVVPKAKKGRVYRTGAWVWPVVLLGGRVAGVWKVDRKAKGTKVEVELFKKRSVSKAAIEAELIALEPLIGPLASLSVA